jgi:5-methylcytosine-specific restriction endonuclease McrA
MRKQHSYCAACGAAGSEVRLYVDHVVELKDGGAWLDPLNAQVLCGSCHNKKTAEVKQARGWQRILDQIMDKLDASPQPEPVRPRSEREGGR